MSSGIRVHPSFKASFPDPTPRFSMGWGAFGLTETPAAPLAPPASGPGRRPHQGTCRVRCQGDGATGFWRDASLFLGFSAGDQKLP